MPNADVITEKVYCNDRPNNNNDLATCLALSNNMQGGNYMFPLLIWTMFAQRMWGNDCARHFDDPQYGYAALSNQIAAFQTRMADNHNTDLLYGQGQYNGMDFRAGIDKLSGGQALLQQTLCGIQAAIAKVEGITGFSAERVINAINLGDANITSTFQKCCCDTRTEIIRMGYENQLGQKDLLNQMGRDSAAIGSQMQMGFDRTNTGLERGFASMGYIAEQNTCRLERAIESASQRQLDALNKHWVEQLRDRMYQMSQDAQTASIVNQLRPTP